MSLSRHRLLAFALVGVWSSGSAGTVSGTGFLFLSGGYVATNNHVVQGADNIRVQTGTGHLVKATVVVRDAANDLAILKADLANHSVLKIRDSAQVLKGASVFTVGFPNTSVQGKEPKVTDGVVSSLSGLAGEPNNFQITVALQPGNSGGPLVDMTGSVIGLVSSKLSAAAMVKRGGAVPENVNYAVKSNYLLELIRSRPEIAGAASVKTAAQQRQSLPDLVRQVEAAIVLIVATSPERPGSTNPLPDNGQPRYERDAQALERFVAGSTALKRGEYLIALRNLGQAANLGHLEAQVMLATMYLNGEGIPRDDGEAFNWFLRAAQQGSPVAQGSVSQMYQIGRGTNKNVAEASRWLHAAAEGGLSAAQFNLGLAYRVGTYGLNVNIAESRRLYRLAAKQGNVDARLNLSSDVANGELEGDVELIEWFTQSAGAGNALISHNLGIMFANGRGVPRNVQVAIAWYRRAVEQGSANSQQSLDRLTRSGAN